MNSNEKLLYYSRTESFELAEDDGQQLDRDHMDISNAIDEEWVRSHCTQLNHHNVIQNLVSYLEKDPITNVVYGINLLIR